MPSRRLLIAVPLVVAAAAAIALALAGLGGGGGPPPLRAEAIEPARAAPRTRGVDSTGRPVLVPRPGRPALVTFLFANCPDVCPLVASEIRAALDRAGPAADGVDVVAISVDPAGDARAEVRGFLARHRLTGRMQYLIGSRARLEPIWKAWLVAAQPGGEDARSLHSARIVLVDGDGQQVGSYPGGIPIAIEDLASDLRTLGEG